MDGRLCADGDYEDGRQTDTTPTGDSSLGQTQQQQEKVHTGATSPTREKGSDPTEQHWEGDEVKELEDCLPSLRWTICGHEWFLYPAWLLDNPKLHTVSLLSPHQARKYHPMSSYDHSKS